MSSCEEACHDDYLSCCNNCWTNDPPWPFDQNGWYHFCCNVKCQGKYMACLAGCVVENTVKSIVDLAGAAAQWVIDHPTEAIIGAVVIIAGVAMVVVAGPAGVAVLVAA